MIGFSRMNPGMRQAAYYGLAIVLAKGISFAMVPVFTHFLEPAEFAALDIIQTLADLLSVLMGLGLADTLFRFAGASTDEQEKRVVAASILGFAILASALFLAIGQVSAPFIAKHLPWPESDQSDRIWEVRIILVSLSLSALILVPLGWLRMRDRAVEYLLGSGGRALFQAALVATALFLGFGVTGVLLGGMIACIALASFVVFRQARETGIRFNLGLMRRYGGYAAPLIGIGLLAFATRSADRWIIAGNVDAVTLAHYALAAKFGLMTAVLLQPYEMWWFPRRFSVLSQPGGEILSARRGELGIVLAMLAALAVGGAGPLAIVWLTPTDYHSAAKFVPALALLAAIHATSTIVNVGAYSGTTTVRPFAVEGMTATLAVIGAVILVPLFESRVTGAGPWGAIIAGFAALLFRLAVIFWLAQRTQRIPYRSIKVVSIGALSAAVVVALTVSQSDGASPLPALLIGAGSILLVASAGLVFGLIGMTDAMRNQLSKLLPLFSSHAFFLR